MPGPVGSIEIIGNCSGPTRMDGSTRTADSDRLRGPSLCGRAVRAAGAASGAPAPFPRLGRGHRASPGRRSGTGPQSSGRRGPGWPARRRLGWADSDGIRGQSGTCCRRGSTPPWSSQWTAPSRARSPATRARDSLAGDSDDSDTVDSDEREPKSTRTGGSDASDSGRSDSDDWRTPPRHARRRPSEPARPRHP